MRGARREGEAPGRDSSFNKYFHVRAVRIDPRTSCAGLGHRRQISRRGHTYGHKLTGSARPAEGHDGRSGVRLGTRRRMEIDLVQHLRICSSAESECERMYYHLFCAECYSTTHTHPFHRIRFALLVFRVAIRSPFSCPRPSDRIPTSTSGASLRGRSARGGWRYTRLL